MNCIPRCEHPKPQMRRENWMNLNGEWDFAFDFGNSGMSRRMFEEERFITIGELPKFMCYYKYLCFYSYFSYNLL